MKSKTYFDHKYVHDNPVNIPDSDLCWCHIFSPDRLKDKEYCNLVHNNQHRSNLYLKFTSIFLFSLVWVSFNIQIDNKSKLTINFQFTQLIVGEVRIVARIPHVRSTFIVVKNVTSLNRTIDSLVLWRCTVYPLYLMKTQIAVFFGGCVRHVKEKSGHSRCEYCGT